MHYPYIKQTSLLSPAEFDFYKKLCALAGQREMVVFAKVRLADLVWIPKSYERYKFFFSKIKSKHIDFVLCDSSTLEIRCLVELDDATHDLPQRHSRDTFVNKVVKIAGHEFVRCSSPEHVCTNL